MKRRAGFTLVELIIAIVVIGILATIVIVNYNAVQAKGRDTQRMSQLASIADAITSYRLKYGDPVTTSCTGGLTASPGTGWFNDSTDTGSGGYSGTTILSCLTAKGYLNNTFVDPSGCSNASGASAPGYTCKGANYGIGYVKLSCADPSNANQTVTVLLAKLEASGSTSNLTSSPLCGSNTWATNYNYNYMLRVD